MPTLVKLNIDLVTKLAKLANNNPNENEANLAARKVCRMLEEADFQFNDAAQPVNQARGATRPNPYHGFNPFEELWRDLNYRRDRQRRYSYDDETRYYSKDNPWSWDPTWKNPAEEKKEPTYEKPKTYQCKKCGHHKTTEFVGHSSQFMCMDCIAKEKFEESKAKHKTPKVSRKCSVCGRSFMTKLDDPFTCGGCYITYARRRKR